MKTFRLRLLGIIVVIAGAWTTSPRAEERDMLWVIITGNASTLVPGVGLVTCHLIRDPRAVSADDYNSDLPGKTADLRSSAADDWAASRATYLPDELAEAGACRKPGFYNEIVKSQLEATAYVRLKKAQWGADSDENTYIFEF